MTSLNSKDKIEEKRLEGVYMLQSQENGISIHTCNGKMLDRGSALLLAEAIRMFYSSIPEDDIEDYNLLVQQQEQEMIEDSLYQEKRTSSEQDDAGYIYIAGNSRYGLFKIGLSRQPLARTKVLNSAVPFHLDYMRLYETETMKKTEQHLHSRFNHLRSKNEWFRLSKKDLIWIDSYLGEDLYG